ncbi:MAG TPA: hypothetical protein PLG56_08065 [Lacunisphaera sp.]|nr:hypothetical protein [Lacunisphaera sp.]
MPTDTDEERKSAERSFQMNTATAIIGLLLFFGSFAFTLFLAVQNIRARREILDLPSGPLYFALFGVCAWATSKRRLRELAEIQKKETS